MRGSGKSVYCRDPKGEIFLVRESNIPGLLKKKWVKLDSKEGKRLVIEQRKGRK